MNVTIHAINLQSIFEKVRECKERMVDNKGGGREYRFNRLTSPSERVVLSLQSIFLRKYEAAEKGRGASLAMLNMQSIF